MNTIRLITLILGILMFPAFAQSQWTLVDDFEDGDTSHMDMVTTSTDPTTGVYIAADPLDETNSTVYVESANYGIAYGDTWVTVPLEDTIEFGETKTFYFRMQTSGAGNSWHIGLTDLSVITGAGWANNAALIQTSPDYSGALAIHNGGGYIVSVPELFPDHNVWYEFWMVIRNRNEGSLPEDLNSGFSKIYVKGPSDTAPQLIAFNAAAPVTQVPFRRKPSGPLMYYMIATNSGPGGAYEGHPWYLDDIYLSAGEVLTSPGDVPPPVLDWAGVDADENGWVDTGDWLGWVNVNDGSDWVWLDSIQSWVHAPDPGAGAAGVWIYFLIWEVEEWAYVSTEYAYYHEFGGSEEDPGNWVFDTAGEDGTGKWAYVFSK